MAIAIRRKPLIDDIEAVKLRNIVYKAWDARKECDKVNQEINGYPTWICIRGKKFSLDDDDVADVKRTVADLEQKKRQYENAEHAAYLELSKKIIDLVPPPPFEDSGENEVPERCLDNGDCYLLLNFVEFLCKRGLMKEPTFSDAKKLILDFDKFGADDGEVEEAL